MDIIEVQLSLYGKLVKKYRTVLFKGQDVYSKTYSDALRWYGLSSEIHYNEIGILFVNNSLKSTNVMTKRTKANVDSAVEIAEVLDEVVTVQKTDDVLVLSQKVGEIFPTKIPEKFITKDYGEHSKEVAESIRQRLYIARDAVSGPDDVQGYAKIKELATLAQKGATRLDAAIKEGVKPLKNVVKSIEDASKKVQGYFRDVQAEAEAEYKKHEDWEAEVARQKELERQERARRRRESLMGIAGTLDPLSGVWSFPFTGDTVSEMAVLEFDEVDFEAILNKLTNLHQKYLAETEAKRKAEEEAKAIAEREAEAMKLTILKYRRKMLEMEGFTFNEPLQAYEKNGVVLHLVAIRDLSEENFEAEIERAKNPQNEAKAVDTDNAPPIAKPVFVEAKDAVDEFIAAVSIDETVEEEPEQVTAQSDGTITRSLVFTKDKPFIDIMLQKTFLRIYPVELDKEATENVSRDRIKLVKDEEELGLRLTVITI